MSEKIEKCLIVCAHYKPLIGGALVVYDAIAKCEPQNIQVLTSYIDYTTGTEVEGWRQFDASAPYTLRRIARMRPNLTIKTPSILGRIVNKLVDISIQRQVWRKIQEVAAQENITHICIGSLDALGWVATKMKDSPSLRSVLYVHGEEVTQKTASQRADNHRKKTFEAADAIIVVSRFTANAVSSLYNIPKEKITCITNGVDTGVFNTEIIKTAPKPANMPTSRFVFACGRLVARKGFDKLIEAWPSVIAACPDIKLCIGGTGPISEQLKNRINALGLQDSVIMLGRVADDDLPVFYKNADIFASPNRTMPDGDTEGFGLVFLEAAALETPSIGGNAGGVPDAITDGKTGILVNGEDINGIAEALIKLLKDDALRNQMGHHALANAQANSWPNKASAFMDVLRST